jgi:exodeoxyribonuclease VII large subunit
MNNIYSVSNIVENVKDIINNNFNFNINIQGEISNFKIYKKQNLYLTLKDRESSINVVFFNFTEKSNIILYDGCKIVVNGLLRLNKKNSYINLYANKIQLFGMGELKEEEENLKKYYMAKGYFDKKNKKTLPDNINNIGLITSVDGAALHDFKKTLITNGYKGNVFVKGCYSQGKKCPSSVADAILFFEDFKHNNDRIDIIVITRGGGSYEDLFGFSNKIIIEAIHNSNICIISAIGHETDNMLSDFVSDIRATTPTDAANIISNHVNNKTRQISDIDNYISYNLRTIIKEKISKYKIDLYNLKNMVMSPQKIIKNKENVLNKLNYFFNYFITNEIDEINLNITKMKQRLDILNPNLVLNKGYSIIYDKNHNLIESIYDIEDNQEIIIRMKDGEYVLNTVNILKEHYIK